MRGPFAIDGAALFESVAAPADSDAGMTVDSGGSGIVPSALRPLARGSHVGLFGGAGLWNVGEALFRARTSTADSIVAINVEACRSQAAATRVASGGRR